MDDSKFEMKTIAEREVGKDTGAIYDDDAFFDNYYKLRQDKDNYNDNIEQPIMRGLIGEVRGISVLDVGCGYGNMCAWLVSKGAEEVLGIDNSSRMIEFAREHNRDAKIRYKVTDAETIDGTLGSFDLVVSSLALHYIKDLDRLFSEVCALCREHGRFVFSMEHPVFTSCLSTDDLWEYDTDGKMSVFRLDHYAVEGVRHVEWLGKTITKYHRKTATIMNSLIRAGFEIKEVIEPSPTERDIEHNERMRQELHRPAYLIISAEKR